MVNITVALVNLTTRSRFLGNQVVGRLMLHILTAAATANVMATMIVTAPALMTTTLMATTRLNMTLPMVLG